MTALAVEQAHNGSTDDLAIDLRPRIMAGKEQISLELQLSYSKLRSMTEVHVQVEGEGYVIQKPEMAMTSMPRGTFRLKRGQSTLVTGSGRFGNRRLMMIVRSE